MDKTVVNQLRVSSQDIRSKQHVTSNQTASLTTLDNRVHLGSLSGKVLLFGGVYSNLQALEQLKRIAEEQGIPPGNCICTGDLVGYCAQPEEVVQLFKIWGVKSILGNVEIQLRDGAEDCGCDFRKGSRCDGFSQMWFPYAQSKLSKSSLEYIATLPNHIDFRYAGKDITVVHGDYFNVSEFVYKSTDWQIKQKNFDATGADVIIAGHCGLPFHQEKEEKTWINPGVIGMPANDGSPNVWYAVLDDSMETFKFKHHQMEYNYKLANARMQTDFLPQEYARTLITGIWDNTEILPPYESGLQGFGIQL
ncbi:metallophosphoesterase family protein [Leeuwenhoekiella marinoflava]|uniref:Calcineurin-like phosphoesterase family protein n=2 Tax=Leeuwenhoekiella marinoflava TaxID=988 RepID=A0A4V1KSH0_9FLAO|nr:metallophosphoesterase family protein [Leeuwenhoekiella marinoflava]RXG31708.1 calcineurin-like phosphoesterase family protein [Leeuwenhoekiella marinoflava]SHF07895.1 Calcineurin-like phosphoesterase superfamily domain-containing protein [Leeuwenhoekiella marinoflava DSM 3653]